MATMYEHTQLGVLMTVILVLGIFCTTFWILYLGFNWFGLGVLVVLDMCLIAFSTLTVEVTENVLEIKCGPGLIHKTFSLQDVRDCFVVSTPNVYGWGIRSMPNSWMFNVSGTNAVELTMKNGVHYRIGTDMPGELAEIIRRVTKGNVAALR